MLAVEKKRGHVHPFGPSPIIQTQPGLRENALWFMFLRALVTTLLLAITLFLQIKETTVISPQDLLPVYSLLGFTYFITIFFAAILPRIQKTTLFIGSQIVYDILFVTALIYITGTQDAIFTFLYLFIIGFASIVYQRTGALYTAILASLCFSTLLILDPIESSEKHLMTLFFNNVAFFLVALLSGYLAQQFRDYRTRLTHEQESVKELEDLNKIIVSNIASGIVTTDVNNHIIYWNQAAEKITGLKFKDIYKKPLFNIFPDLKKHWIKKADSKKHVSGLRQKFVYVTTKKEELLLGFASSSLQDANQEKVGTILIFEDLTKMIEMEQNMHRSEKLAAVGKLAAGIAHEIRNPLASMSGSIEMLSHELEVSPENKKLMNIILKETDRLNKLVNEFLDYVRPEDQKMKECNVYEILEDTLTAMSMQKNKNPKIKINFEPDQKDLKILGNKEKLKQVFWNLLINATQAIEDGGTVTVRTHTTTQDLKIDISDTGCGILEDDIPKIFDPFFTTKSKGTGLGLSVVHKIIEAHHGRITVFSTPEKGTTFSINLPIKGLTPVGGDYGRH
ncbi:MAG: hypothetical protein A3B70_02815 [Deltaproteobacteria bacterium RIFCSPHIGHO2_02_FULL_40_11]|nr:MAG: hypothetical protein A3B70_02815 [Deltaproteobacteria bacterium RIFCSPHIGHO2_02_FULL_40_11]